MTDPVIAMMQEEIRDLKKSISALQIDSQRHIKSNTMIPPGIATKLSYDSNGLILNGTKLESSDIPEITIDHISGLRKLLNDKIGSSEFKRLQIEAGNNVLKRGDPVATGVKVNYDENGLVVSSTELSRDDIPLLPMSKVEGLAERLSLLESQHSGTTSSNVEDLRVAAGTFCKVSYDTYGRVTGGTNLTLNDIPVELITRINQLETMISSLASGSTVSALSREVTKKLDANDRIGSGTFTKVSVDSNGLVTKGDKLTIRDLPDINIDNIVDLETTLRKKADVNDIINLNDTLSTITNVLSKIGDVQNLKTLLNMKADNNEVKSLIAQVDSMRSMMDELTNKIPNELIMEQLRQIESELSSLSGRVSVIESKLNIPNV